MLQYAGGEVAVFHSRLLVTRTPVHLSVYLSHSLMARLSACKSIGTSLYVYRSICAFRSASQSGTLCVCLTLSVNQAARQSAGRSVAGWLAGWLSLSQPASRTLICLSVRRIGSTVWLLTPLARVRVCTALLSPALQATTPLYSTPPHTTTLLPRCKKGTKEKGKDASARGIGLPNVMQRQRYASGRPRDIDRQSNPIQSSYTVTVRLQKA